MENKKRTLDTTTFFYVFPFLLSIHFLKDSSLNFSRSDSFLVVIHRQKWNLSRSSIKSNIYLKFNLKLIQMYMIYDFNAKNLNKITHKRYFQVSINKKVRNQIQQNWGYLFKYMDSKISTELSKWQKMCVTFAKE